MPDNITSVALDVRDKTRNDLIRSTKLYLYAKEIEDKVSVTGIYNDGSFHTDIDKSTEFNSKREDLFEVIRQLLYDESQEYLLSSKSLVDEEDDTDETVVVSIKTKDIVPITIGSFTLNAIDVDAVEFQEQNNLFNWIELINLQKGDLLKENANYKLMVESTQKDNEILQSSYDTMKDDYELIIRDLEEKFYYLLNAKKDKIWELTRDRVTSDIVDGHNGDFFEMRQTKRARTGEEVKTEDIKMEFKDESDSYKVKSEASLEIRDDEVTVKMEPSMTDIEIVKSVLDKEEEDVLADDDDEDEDEEVDADDDNSDDDDDNDNDNDYGNEDDGAISDADYKENDTKDTQDDGMELDAEGKPELNELEIVKDSLGDGPETDYSSDEIDKDDEEEKKKEKEAELKEENEAERGKEKAVVNEEEKEKELVKQEVHVKIESQAPLTPVHSEIKDNSTDYESSDEE